MDFVEGPYNASDSRTHFVHGPLSGFGGTCVNLPVLYLAVGRRLGYPLKLVTAKEHLFVRWSGEAVFNIEATSRGFEPRSDEYHSRSPRVLSARELASGQYLRDFSPRQELAEFLLERGQVALDNLWITDALSSFTTAAKLDPRYHGDLATATKAYDILSNLRGPPPPTEAILHALIVGATPPAKEPWERWATHAAHERLQSILWRRATAERLNCAV